MKTLNKWMVGIGIALGSVVMGCSLPVSAEINMTQIAIEAGYPVTEDVVPKATIVVDADTGQIVYGHNIDGVRDPASTTKLMVAYLVFESIKDGKFTLDTEVTATQTDEAISQIYALSNSKVYAGVTYTVRELLTALFVPSSNVATIMLSHLIEPDDSAFLKKMNQTAERLQMTNTTFYNTSGAIAEAFEGYYAPVGYDLSAANQTTAKDLAVLAFHFLKQYPEVLEFTNQSQATIKAGTPYEDTFEGYNHSLEGAIIGAKGVDGMKTGSSPSAGYNAVVTGKRDDTRLICVVLGASYWGNPDGEYQRHYFITSLINHIFANYTRTVVAKSGHVTLANNQQVATTQDLMGLVNDSEPVTLAYANSRLFVQDNILPVEQRGIPAQSITMGTTSISPDTSKGIGELLREHKLIVMIVIGLVAVVGLFILIRLLFK